MLSAETIVIGAGVVGASVAYHLTERGAKGVVVLDRGKKQGTGSTGRATGGARAQFETEINIRMSLYSLDFLADCGFDTGYDPRGYLFFATTDEQFDYIKRNAEFQRSLGVKDVSVVGPREIAELVPIMETHDIVGGSFGARDGFVNPLAIMRGFTRGAESRGAQFWWDANVSSIVVEGGRVRGVRTREGVIDCERIVLATGAWAHELAKTAEVELPVTPQRRQIVWAKAAAPLAENTPMVIDLGTGFHFRPARDFVDETANADRTEVLFAYPDPDEYPSYHDNFEDSFIEKVYARAKERSQFLYESKVVREKCRAGLYENTPDHHAILGACDVEGLFLASGFSGHGVMHSPATGRALAEIMTDGEAKFLDVSCLSLERFKTGKLLKETAFI